MNDARSSGEAAAAPICARASTNEAYTLETLTLEPYHPGMPLHQHPAHAQGYYIIQGTLAVTHDSRTITLTQGELVVIPPGVTHTCWNPTAAPTIILVSYRPQCDWY
jgi:quercetin dioxygenase-like cupin family protein